MYDLRLIELRRFILPFVLAFLLFAASIAQAATIHVDDDCSLRQAITSANEDSWVAGCVRGSGHDLIIMQRDDNPTEGRLPTITSTIEIHGNSHELTIQSGHDVFHVNHGDLTLRDITISYATYRNDEVIEIWSSRLRLVNVEIENCRGGIEQESSHTIFEHGVDICGLADEDSVSGDHSFDYPSKPPDYPPDTCSMLSGGVMVAATYGLHSGVQCKTLAGMMPTVDVYGYVSQGVEVCFPGQGMIDFLDAAFSPRQSMPVESYRKGDAVCAWLTRAGTLMLQPGFTSGMQAMPAPAPAPVVEPMPAPDLVGCPVVTTGHLKLRTGPSLEADVLGFVYRGSTVGKVGRAMYWVQINDQFGRSGWIGGKYVDEGDC